MNYIKQSIIFLLSCMLFVACSDDKDPLPDDGDENNNEVSITLPEYTDLAYTKVTLKASISSGGQSLTRKGFCYDTAPDVNISKSIAEIISPGETMTAYLMNLTEGTTYYAKAFVTTGKETVYSSEISFTTLILSEEDKLTEELANYKAPTYSDNYTSIAEWSQRSQWNLANVHDPTILKADDGYFYMYQTDASYGNAHTQGGHFHGRRSKDLVNWEYLGGTMNAAPEWIKTKLNEIRNEQGLAPIDNPGYGFWAPVARKVSTGKYRMYYSIVIDNYIKTGAANTSANFDNSWTERAFIGMMETNNPASNIWEDKGFVVCSSTDKGINDWARPSQNDWNGYFKWNAIDPTYIITKEEQHWLIYGSWHSGIAALQVDAETGKPLNEMSAPWDIPESSAYGKLIMKRGNSRWQGSEGPEIIYNPETDYYYLFMAYDELSVAYNTRVARSKNIDGPYYGIDGANVTSGANMLPVATHPYKFNDDHGWVGISHCAVFNDDAGNWYYASQGRLPHDVPGIHASNAIMMGHIRSIQWTSDGWPIVMPERYGAVPQAKIKESELIGNWQHIDMSYRFGQQKAASIMTFGADHKISEGPWKSGSWSYDEEKQILTANGVELHLQREVNWETSPRKHTIVYAGYTTSKTYWGKKAD